MGGCGTGDQPEPSRDDSPHRLARFWIAGERRVFHALLDFKPPNRNFRRIRNRFIDIGCHALVPYYCLWQRWQDKANICRPIRCNRTIYRTVVSAYEMLDERPSIWFGHIEIDPKHRSQASGLEWQPEIGRNFGLSRHYPCRATKPYRVCWDANRLRNQIGELSNRQLFGNDLRSQFSNSLD